MKREQLKTVQHIGVTDNLLNEIVHKIVKHFHPLKIILFGSYVWGKPGRDSDIDLLVIMENKERPAKRAVAVRGICQPRFLSMDVLVRTPEEIQQRLEIGDFFFLKILNQGRVLHEAR